MEKKRIITEILNMTTHLAIDLTTSYVLSSDSLVYR